MNIKPINDRILVKRAEVLDKTPSGIIIPDTSKDRPSKGTVIAVGEGKRNKDGKLIPLQVKEGDVVFFCKWVGNELPEDKSLLLLREEEILAIIQED